MTKLKPINQQVVALMGASSGIGRATALRFAEKGAKVVVSARGEEGLSSLVEEIRGKGGEATTYVASPPLPRISSTSELSPSSPLAETTTFAPFSANRRPMILAGYGHLPHVECPDRFAEAVLRFLDEAEA